MEHHDLLVEIFTEELPPKRLKTLEQAFALNIEKQLKAAQLEFSSIKSFATPRRLAVIVFHLAEHQPAQKIEHKGPSITLAYDAQKQLTPAGLGFLKKCGISTQQLSTTQTDKGECLYFSGEKPGLSVDALIPEIIKTALKELPIPKPMRWANHDFSFIRPVHSVVLLYGERIIPAEFFGLQTQRHTQGHRQLSHSLIEIGFPENYAAELEEQGCVIVDSEDRKAIILDQVHTTLQALSEATSRAELKIAITEQQEYENLLDEITALVEWPKVLLCRFDESFLKVPKEALMASMQGHQKCFAISDVDEKLLPYFIAVSNLQSKDEMAVIHGNERVMRARLSDAKFFYDTDLKTSLESYTPKLEKTIYQEKLGTLKDKVDRVTKLAVYFAEQIGANMEATKRAAELCKLDLFSHMVGEFPELQGIMGKYYASHDGEKAEVANAIEEHYWPRFADDKIPTAPVSVALALADRLDTIVSFFSIDLAPTGSKDPFALRRAAAGFLKIIIENKRTINLFDAISFLLHSKRNELKDNFVQVLNEFFMERFKTIAVDQGISADIFNAAIRVVPGQLYYTSALMNAIQQFKSHPALPVLIRANKRVNNFLAKEVPGQSTFSADYNLYGDLEKKLCDKTGEVSNNIGPLLEKLDYFSVLLKIAELAPIIDDFFENIRVDTDDQKIRENRLCLLRNLRVLFARVADFSELQL